MARNIALVNSRLNARRDIFLTNRQGCPGKISNGYAGSLNCIVARASRNDGERSALNSPRHCERSNPGATKKELDCFVARAPKKKQMSKALIESSFFRASYAERLDCRGARAPRNDGERAALNSPRHCERSAAIQEPRKQAHVSSTRVGPTGPAFWPARWMTGSGRCQT